LLNRLFFKLSQPQAREKADKEGFEVDVVKTSFKANTKALAENEGDGIAKVNLVCPEFAPVLLKFAFNELDNMCSSL
jgi:hypothetical protein